MSDDSAFKTHVIETAGDLEDALKLRVEVFVEEQKVPPEEEVDEYDALPADKVGALHVITRRSDVSLGTGRLIYPKELRAAAKIGRVAVVSAARGLGVGRAVMEKLHDEARNRGIASIQLGAQLHAIPFYEKLGYTAYGDIFLDAKIEHRMMECRLD